MTLANRGFMAVAIDGRYHGERAGNPPGLATPYATAIFDAYRSGRGPPFFYDTVLDVHAAHRLPSDADADVTGAYWSRGIFEGRHRDLSGRGRWTRESLWQLPGMACRALSWASITAPGIRAPGPLRRAESLAGRNESAGQCGVRATLLRQGGTRHLRRVRCAGDAAAHRAAAAAGRQRRFRSPHADCRRERKRRRGRAGVHSSGRCRQVVLRICCRTSATSRPPNFENRPWSSGSPAG